MAAIPPKLASTTLGDGNPLKSVILYPFTSGYKYNLVGPVGLGDGPGDGPGDGLGDGLGGLYAGLTCLGGLYTGFDG